MVSSASDLICSMKSYMETVFPNGHITVINLLMRLFIFSYTHAQLSTIMLQLVVLEGVLAMDKDRILNIQIFKNSHANPYVYILMCITYVCYIHTLVQSCFQLQFLTFDDLVCCESTFICWRFAQRIERHGLQHAATHYSILQNC